MTGNKQISVAAWAAMAAAVAGSLLGACGQKGPLYIPGVEHPEGGVLRLPLPASAPPATGGASVPAAVPAVRSSTLPLPASPSSSPTSSTSPGH